VAALRGFEGERSVQSLKLWAFILAAVWIAFYAAAFGLGLLPREPVRETFAYDWMVLAGGPLCLLVWTPIALKWERLAVSWLWLGSAVAAIGLALRSGPYIGRYFGGMALIVLPQVAVASLLTVHIKKIEKAERQSKKGQ
jgi:hypothetical protein